MAIEPDYSVQPLEGLWWVEGSDPAAYLSAPLDQWRWRLLIGQPDFISAAELEEAKAIIAKKKGEDVSGVRLEGFDEGLAVANHVFRPLQRRASDHRTDARLGA